MSKDDLKFFTCYSPNLRKFFSASGLKPMHTNSHWYGVQVRSVDGDTEHSFSSVHAASDYTGIDVDVITEVRDKLLADNDPNGKEVDGFLLKKRVRSFWVYEMTRELEDALKAWKDTGPRKNS